MAETAERARPRTPEGTTDWEIVFEDAELGFIPLIAQAHTPGALKECATLVILKLFPRRDDLHEVEHFATELAEIITEGAGAEDMAAMGDGVTALLREIKDERIRLAAEYAARKKKGKVKDRRSAPPKSAARRAAAWAGWTAAAVAAFAFTAFLVSLSDKPRELAPAAELVAQMKQAAKSGRAPLIHVYGGILKRQLMDGNLAVIAKKVPQKPCVNAAWTLAVDGRVMINGKMPNRVTAALLAEMCALTRESEHGGGYGGNGGQGNGGGKAPADPSATLTWFP